MRRLRRSLATARTRSASRCSAGTAAEPDSTMRWYSSRGHAVMQGRPLQPRPVADRRQRLRQDRGGVLPVGERAGEQHRLFG